MKPFNVNEIRKDFQILEQEIYGHPLVYLDNAATTQKPKVVTDAMQHFYTHDNANINRGVHTLSQRSTLQFEEVRKQVQLFINAKTDKEIIFTRGTTEGINLVAQSYGRHFLKPGDEILITGLEHHANIVPWQMLCQSIGTILKVAPLNMKGEVIFSEYEKQLSEKTKLVAFSHVSNSLGTINPIQAMIASAKQVGAKVLIDGAQAIAHFPVDVQRLDCDFYVFSGHKVYGPTGIGVLYGKQELLEAMPPWQGGGDMIRYVSFEKTLYNDLPNKFEAGTPNIAGVIGLGAALTYMQNLDAKALHQYEYDLFLYARECFSQEKDIRMIGDANEKIAIFSFVMENVHPHDIGTILDHEGIAVRTGHHCTMPVMDFFKVPATTRASFTFYNTQAEVDALIRGLHTVRKLFA